MKELTLINEKVFYLDDVEAENVKRACVEDGFFELRNGTFVNAKSVATISDVPKVEYWSTYVVNENANGKFINRDGEHCYLDPRNMDDIYLDYSPEVKLLLGENAIKLGNGQKQIT